MRSQQKRAGGGKFQVEGMKVQKSLTNWRATGNSARFSHRPMTGKMEGVGNTPNRCLTIFIEWFLGKEVTQAHLPFRKKMVTVLEMTG